MAFHHSVSCNTDEPDASEVCSLSDPFPQGSRDSRLCLLFICKRGLGCLLFIDCWLFNHLRPTSGISDLTLVRNPFPDGGITGEPQRRVTSKKATAKTQGQCEPRANELSVSVCIEREPVSLQMCLSAMFTFCLFGVILYHMGTSGMCLFAKSTFLVSSKWPST